MKPWAILLTIGMASATALSAQRTFRAGVDLIHFSVVVTDKQGKHVAGLTAEDFEILEGDKPQAIKFFSAGEMGEELPLHVGLLLDTSGSMDLDIKDARTAVIKFLNAMERAADVTLVDFDTEVRVARYGVNDFPRLIERIRNRKPSGWTALYDALATYLNGAAEQTGQKVLIMYTDGGDTRSSFSLSQLIDMLRVSDVTVYALGYLENQSSSARHDQRMQLQRLSGMTGGQAFFPSSVKELESIYDKIQKELSARYSLGYTSADTRTDGKWREVKVRLKRSELKGAKIRTREGYFAPFRESSQTRQ